MSQIPNADAIISVRNLTADFGGPSPAVRGVDLDLYPGKILGLVGESGSGKSVTARALMGLSGAQVSADRLLIRTKEDPAPLDAREFSQAQWRDLRGSHTAMILQDALSALDPLRPIYREMTDNSGIPRSQRKTTAATMLETVGMPDPARRATQRSTELSGGMRQRVLIAQALIGDPQVVIADEATTALDTQLTQLVLDQLVDLKEQGRAVLMISHDLAQISEVADEIAVMRNGEVVEAGPTREILEAPEHAYTQQLLRAVPAGVPRFQPLAQTSDRVEDSRSEDAPTEIAVEATGLSKKFGDHQAVSEVSLKIPAGQTLGVVGGSGSGKTTTARMILGLTAPDEGTVTVFGNHFVPKKERHRRSLRHLLGAIYQDPLSSFDPRYTVDRILKNALSAGRNSRTSRLDPQVSELLDMVELPSGLAARYPHELSGGQRQRIAIARALAPEPRVLILDEPVSALDVSVQATVLDLLDRIQLETGASYLFITHDMAVVEHMSDSLAVMQDGRIVETGPTKQLMSAPEHEYTQLLLDSIPDWKPSTQF